MPDMVQMKEKYMTNNNVNGSCTQIHLST